MTTFSSGMINLKRNNVKAGIHEDLGKAVFEWFMSAKWNKIPAVNTTNSDSTECVWRVLRVKNYHDLSLENLKIRYVQDTNKRLDEFRDPLRLDHTDG